MDNKTVAAIAVSTLLLGCGVSGLLFVKPAYEEQQKLKLTQLTLEGEERARSAEFGVLSAKLQGMAMSTISYFDLSRSPNKRREMETKTVETLASLTEIFNDNHIVVQVLEPKGESSGMSKPVPSPVGSPSPGASASPAAADAGAASPVPGAPTPTPAVSLTHKAFELQLRGEYQDLVDTLTEIQSLPKAISINEYNLRLINRGEEASDRAAERKESPSLLELTCQVSITFLMDSPHLVLPSLAPAPGASAVSYVPTDVSMMLFRWATSWLGEPAYGAVLKAEAPVARGAAPAARKSRFTLTGVAWEDGALRLKTSRGTPRFQVVGGHKSLLVLQLEDTVPAGGTFPFAGNGVVSVAAAPDPHKAGAIHLFVQTDGTARFKPGLNSRFQIELRPENASAHTAKLAGAKTSATHAARKGAVKPVVTVLMKPRVTVAPAESRPVEKAAPTAPRGPAGVAQRSSDSAKTSKSNGAVAHPGMTIVVKPAGAAISSQPTAAAAGPDDWDRIADEATVNWERRALQQAKADAGSLHRSAVPFGPVSVAAQVVHRDASMPATTVRPAVAPKAELAKPLGKPAQAQPARTAAAEPDAAGYTFIDAIRFEGGDLVVETHGAAPRSAVLGGHRSLLLVSLENSPVPGPGRLFPVNHRGIKQVRAALYDNRTMMSRLAIDTDGSVRLTQVSQSANEIRFRVTPIAQATLANASGPATIKLSDASTSAIRATLGQELPTPRPSHPAVKARSVKVKQKAAQRPVAARRQVAIAPAQRTTTPRTTTRTTTRTVVTRVVPLAPNATPTPMAIPRQALVPSGRPMPRPVTSVKPGTPGKAPAAPKPEPTPTPIADLQPSGPTLQRSLNGTYRFPIDRDKATGRVNPFKALRNPQATPKPGLVPVLPPGMMNPPAPASTPKPLPPGALPALPGAPSGAQGSTIVMPAYSLQAVMMGGNQPPIAVIQVGGKALQVGLNESLPGNAKVKAIRSDHVILSTNGRDVRLNLKR